MMGGGFGGCTLNIVHGSRLEEFILEVKRKYLNQFNIELTTHVVETGNGTQVI
jgi:galactokinase